MEIVTKCPKVLTLASAHFISITTFQDRTKRWNDSLDRRIQWLLAEGQKRAQWTDMD